MDLTLTSANSKSLKAKHFLKFSESQVSNQVWSAYTIRRLQYAMGRLHRIGVIREIHFFHFAVLCKFCNWLGCMCLVSLHVAVLLSYSVFKGRNQTRQSLKQRRLKGYFMDLTLIGTKEANLAIYIPAARHCRKFTMAQVSTPYQESNTCDRLSTNPPACLSYFLLTTLQLKKIVLSSQTKTSPHCKQNKRKQD